MLELFNRVSAWNAARYDREYDAKLAHSLLSEEYYEWIDSTDEVNGAKELGDVVFVALGVLWKLNIPLEEQQKAADTCGQYVANLTGISDIPPGFYIGTMLDMLRDDFMSPMSVCHNISYLVQAQFKFTGISDEMPILNAVCTSNETKPAIKTASNVKANIDKGEGFVPAEKEIAKLLSRIVH